MEISIKFRVDDHIKDDTYMYYVLRIIDLIRDKTYHYQ